MKDLWVEAQLHLRRRDHKKVLLQYVGPSVTELEQKGLLDTFHFLHEPGPRLLLRVRVANGRSSDEVWKTLERGAGRIQELLAQPPVRGEYDGDMENFGPHGQPSVMSFLEAGSRVALVDAEPAHRVGPNFCRFDLVHYFLNQLGHDRAGEADFHRRAWNGSMSRVQSSATQQPPSPRSNA